MISSTAGVDVADGDEGAATLVLFVYFLFSRWSEDAGVATFFTGVGAGSGEYAFRLAADSRRVRAGMTRRCGVSSAILTTVLSPVLLAIVEGITGSSQRARVCPILARLTLPPGPGSVKHSKKRGQLLVGVALKFCSDIESTTYTVNKLIMRVRGGSSRATWYLQLIMLKGATNFYEASLSLPWPRSSLSCTLNHLAVCSIFKVQWHSDHRSACGSDS